MITYSFSITNTQNFQTIINTLETTYSALMHTTNPLPSSLTYINGAVGLSSSPNNSMLYIYFFENENEYQLKDSSGTVVYQAKPLATIPSQSQIENIIGGYL